MFAIYGKHVAEPRWPTVVHSMAKLSSRAVSKLQGLLNVNINIRKSQPKMFCTYAGTKTIDSGESDSVTVFYLWLERL